MNTKLTWIIFTTNFFALVYAQERNAICDLPFSNAVLGRYCDRRTIFAYNKQWDQCIFEEFEGCDLSGNQFETLSSCQEHCTPYVLATATPSSICAFLAPQVAPGKCPKRYVWSYDLESDECTSWEDSACLTEGNIFLNYGDCRSNCIQASSTVVWSNPRCDWSPAEPLDDGGNCEEITIYRYDRDRQECVWLSYKGCRIKLNMFRQLEDCENLCRPRNLADPSEPAARQNVCELPISKAIENTLCQRGTEVFSYNQETRNCEKWTYLGCEIIGNKFRTYRECTDYCLPEFK